MLLVLDDSHYLLLHTNGTTSLPYTYPCKLSLIVGKNALTFVKFVTQIDFVHNQPSFSNMTDISDVVLLSFPSEHISRR